jgi:hypothetical protein
LNRDPGDIVAGLGRVEFLCKRRQSLNDMRPKIFMGLKESCNPLFPDPIFQRL